MKSNAVPFILVLFLASVFALSPLATDSYLAAIPQMASDLNVVTGSVAITVSIYIFVMALGQMFGGPLCDRAGRRFSMMLGLTLFVVGGFVIAGAGNLTILYVGRCLQAFGGGIAFVCVPAIIRDVASGKAAAKLFTLVALIMMVAPAVAPIFGTLVLKTLGWTWIFILMSLFAVITAFIGAVSIPKTNKPAHQKSPSITQGFIEVFNTREARKYAIILAATFSALMIFLTNSSMIYIEHYGLSEEMFAGILLVNTIASIVANRINAFLLNNHSPQKLLSLFVGLQVFGLLILLTSQVVMPESWVFSATGFIIASGSLGGIFGNSNACFMAYFPEKAGIASAFIGASQSIGSSIIAALSTLLLSSGIWTLAIMMLVISGTAFLISTGNEKHTDTLDAV
ncbi:multidrug effflux MFS transporter [Vibrio sp. RC27]